MPDQTPARTTTGSLAETIERQIDLRTWGRVRRLRIDSASGRLVVHGITSSYYVKQLALAAVREVTDSEPVDVDIQVG